MERSILLTPFVERLTRYAAPPDDFGEIATDCGFFENGRDLLFGESAFTHLAAPFAAPAAARLSMHLAYFRGKGQSDDCTRVAPEVRVGDADAPPKHPHLHSHSHLPDVLDVRERSHYLQGLPLVGENLYLNGLVISS